MGVIFSAREKCKGCYACIRVCPTKAIKVEGGKADVINERCIGCGTCVRVCMPKAKQVEKSTGEVWELLTTCPPVIATLDPSFPAAFPEVQPRQLVTALKKLGFTEVMEAAFGAELIAREYNRLVNTDLEKPIITSHCPVIVSYIQKHHPHLIDYLAPIVSPSIAMGRVIRWQYDPNAKVVFIGPCIAAKAEIRDEKVAGVVDAVLTFAELKEMFQATGIDPATQKLGQFAGPKPCGGRAFSIAGGLLKLAKLSSDPLQSDTIVVKGRGHISSVVKDFSQGKIHPHFVDLRLCQGCIGGPAIDNSLSIFAAQEIITEYTLREEDPVKTEKDLAKYGQIDLSRKFTCEYSPLPQPTEEEIEDVLKQLNRLEAEDQLNCGTCGYNSCRELAIAVCQGLAESEMCWPYLVKRLETAQEELIRAEKLTSLGQMAASIAHEINNPLAGVLIYTKLLSKKVASDAFSQEEALGYLSKMESELSRSSKIIRNLLDFARQTEPLLRLVDINQVLEQALSLVGHQAQLQNVEVVREFTPSLPEVTADFDQLQQVFTNLTLNAIQAMPDGGKVSIRSSVVDSEIKVDVQDTGCGIPKENLPKLFTPFFTTKEKGTGVGLGLAVVHGIIERHKGRVKVKSEVGKGTTFSVYLGVYSDENG